MKWEEIIAEARTAGVLAFCADDIAVLKRGDAAPAKSSKESLRETGGEGRESGQGKSESSEQSAS